MSQGSGAARRGTRAGAQPRWMTGITDEVGYGRVLWLAVEPVRLVAENLPRTRELVLRSTFRRLRLDKARALLARVVAARRVPEKFERRRLPMVETWSGRTLAHVAPRRKRLSMVWPADGSASSRGRHGGAGRHPPVRDGTRRSMWRPPSERMVRFSPWTSSSDATLRPAPEPEGLTQRRSTRLNTETGNDGHTAILPNPAGRVRRRVPSGWQAFGSRYHIVKFSGRRHGRRLSAWDAELGVSVAVKVIGRRLPRPDGVGRDRTPLQARLLPARQVNDRHVVRITIGEIDGIKSITMEYVDGRTCRRPQARREAAGCPGAAARSWDRFRPGRGA